MPGSVLRVRNDARRIRDVPAGLSVNVLAEESAQALCDGILVSKRALP